MRRFRLASLLAVAGLYTLCAIASAEAAPPSSDSLLPKTTKGFLSIPDVNAADEHWRRTDLAKLVSDPKMKPFVDDLAEQIKNKMSKSGKRLGVTWEDLQGVPAGEASMAIIQPAPEKSAIALTVDITGRRVRADQLLAKIDANLLSRGAKKSKKMIESVETTVYDIPGEGGRPASRAFYAIYQETLLAVDDEKEFGGMLTRFRGKSTDALKDLPAYQAVVAKSRQKAAAHAAQIAWFIEPFGFVEALRAADGVDELRRGKDMLHVLANQGFSAVQGVGGSVCFAVDDFELLHRTAVYAPAVEGRAEGEKYVRGARLLDFPNGDSFDLQEWVPREVATVMKFNVRLENAFDAVGSIIDEMANTQVFQDTLDSIKSDPDGPKVDLREDIVRKLEEQVTIVTDYQLPITPKSERVLIAVKSTDPEALAKTIDRVMERDPHAERRTFRGHVIWEVSEEDVELPPMVDVPQIGPAVPEVGGPAPNANPPKKVEFPNSAITVAYGHLLRATHVDLLEKVLAAKDNKVKLTEALDYQLVQSQFERLEAGQSSFRYFSRTDEELRPTYELIRMGEMPASETMFGRLLNRAFDNGEEGFVREQKIDGTKLPSYDMVRRYLGPGGTFVETQDDGWLIVGFMLSKHPVVEVGAAPARENQ